MEIIVDVPTSEMSVFNFIMNRMGYKVHENNVIAESKDLNEWLSQRNIYFDENKFNELDKFYKNMGNDELGKIWQKIINDMHDNKIVLHQMANGQYNAMALIVARCSFMNSNKNKNESNKKK